MHKASFRLLFKSVYHSSQTTDHSSCSIDRIDCHSFLSRVCISVRPRRKTKKRAQNPNVQFITSYYVVPNSRACTAIYLRGKCSPTRPYYALHAYSFQEMRPTRYLFGSFFIILPMYIFLQAYPFFSVAIQDFLSFGYCNALKDGLACNVKVFRNGARTSLLLSTGVPSMQTWPIIRNERRFQLLHCF